MPGQTEEEKVPLPEAARLKAIVNDEKMAGLERDVALLRNEVAELRRFIEEFKAQFE
jgi:hypothetical protein